MISIPQNFRYLAQTLNTRYHMAKTYRNGISVAFICRRYKVSKALEQAVRRYKRLTQR